MATKNNWLKTNIRDKLLDPTLDFHVWHECHDTAEFSWETCIAKTVDDLTNLNKKLYVPYSGGMDSEYVMKTLKHLNPIPVIVSTPGNRLELSYAFHYCKHNNITPVVIEKTESEMLKIYYEDIFTKLNGYGIDSVALLTATRYIYDKNGVAIVGEHAYDDVNEWDFYNDALVDIDASIYFFMWIPELVKAMRKEYDGGDHQEFKHRLYGVPFRPKFVYEYSVDYKKAFSVIRSKRVHNPSPRNKVIFNDI